MKTIIAAVIVALSPAACAGSNNSPPAQAPSSSAAQDTPSTPSTGAIGATSMMGTGTSTDSSSTTASTPGAAPMPAPSTTSTPSTDGAATPADGWTSVQNRDGAAPTPMSQGNSYGEIAITASIRRNVMHAPSLSFTAKNVEIITVGTKVTLRGHVRSDSERTTIERFARTTAGVTDVDDQLAVKK
jgi:hyperosmotically inducible periplasmic protein